MAMEENSIIKKRTVKTKKRKQSIKVTSERALAGVAQWIECQAVCKLEVSQVLFPVGAHA